MTLSLMEKFNQEMEQRRILKHNVLLSLSKGESIENIVISLKESGIYHMFLDVAKTDKEIFIPYMQVCITTLHIEEGISCEISFPEIYDGSHGSYNSEHDILFLHLGAIFDTAGAMGYNPFLFAVAIWSHEVGHFKDPNLVSTFQAAKSLLESYSSSKNAEERAELQEEIIDLLCDAEDMANFLGSAYCPGEARSTLWDYENMRKETMRSEFKDKYFV